VWGNEPIDRVHSEITVNCEGRRYREDGRRRRRTMKRRDGSLP